MPILGTRLFDELQDDRMVCITGPVSGGKSRLGFDLALYYWRKGYRVFSNVGHTYEHYMGDDGLTLFKSFVIVDEGGEYVRQSKIASAITRSAGKADYYVLFTGKRLPHKNLQDIIIRPRFDFYHNYGLPFILWSCKVNSTDKPYKFTFVQYFPQAVHGVYSTLSSSSSIEKIFLRADNTVKRLAEMEGEVAGSQSEAGFEGLADDLSEGLGSSLS